MSWGYKIALVYGGFAAFMVSMVVLCVRQTDIHLVSPDYYKEEIAYQSQIEQLQNAHSLTERLQLHYEAPLQAVQLHFATLATRTGEILFFRPSDARKDRTWKISTDAQANQTIPVGRLDKGLWKVKIRWQSNQKKYLQEETLVIQ